MQRLTGFGDRSAYRGCFLSIGNFDGVHRGHQAILRRLVEFARAHKAPAAVMTFEPPPLAILHPDRRPPRLTTASQKAALLEGLGVDVVVEYPTDRALLELSPDEFYNRIVVQEFHALGLVEGPNFFFGHGRSGNVETLRSLCQSHQRELEIVVPATVDGEVVSSSRIRELLIHGNVFGAAIRLGRSYRITGVVSEGARRGRELGFPTANLTQVETLLPAEGVYAGWCLTPQGRAMAAVNIGGNPTFQESDPKIEAHLLDFSGDLYGQQVSLEFVSRIRGLTTFPDRDALKSQIQQDLAATRAALASERS